MIFLEKNHNILLAYFLLYLKRPFIDRYLKKIIGVGLTSNKALLGSAAVLLMLVLLKVILKRLGGNGVKIETT